MTHDERQALIRAPITITRHGSTYPWAGALITDSEYDERGFVENILRYEREREGGTFDDLMRAMEE